MTDTRSIRICWRGGSESRQPGVELTGELEGRGIAVSMDGRGRCMDNIFIERLWRSLKYEEVYLRTTGWCRRRGRASTATSSSTITSGRIRAWRIGRRRTSTRVEVCGHDTEVNSEGGRCCYWGAAPIPPEFSAFLPELAVFGSTIIEALERRIGLRRNAT